MNNKTSTQLDSTLNSKQNSIFMGLLSVLTEDQANEVMEKWSIYFNETGSIFKGLNNFVKEVCQNYGVVDQQRDLLKALHRALLNTDRAANVNGLNEKARNGRSLESNKEAESSEGANSFIELEISSPEFITFQSLFLNILDLLEQSENDFGGKLNSFLTELTQSMPWSEGQQYQVLSLINSGKTIQSRTYLPDQLKSFIKYFQSWLEDELGSKNAIQIINRSADKVKIKPENHNYNVSKFL